MMYNLPAFSPSLELTASDLEVHIKRTLYLNRLTGWQRACEVVRVLYH